MLEPDGSTYVQSLARGLAVIRAFGADRPRLSLSDVARATDLTRASARRFLLTLESEGYVRARDGLFELTPRVLELGFSYLSAQSLPEVAQPHLETLSHTVGESSSASILDGTDIVYIARVPTRRIMSVGITIGTRFPAYVTSMGRVLLAFASADDRETYFEGFTPTAFTSRTVTDRDALEQELDRPALREYTQVIVQEADRLRSLMEKLLAPQNASHYSALNIHEVLERVRSVVLAEMPEGLKIRRDYDISLPALVGDKEQLIQTMLNIVRNAAQAMQGHGQIVLRTRIARQVTLVKRRHRLAVMVQIVDNGPGIQPELQDKIFYPLVSGRADGHGLGLTLAQDFVSQHGGTIEFDSEPGRTCFTVMLPLP